VPPASTSTIWDDISGDVPQSAVDDTTCGDGGNNDDICRQMYSIETATCVSLGKYRSKAAGRRCHGTAATRFSECLRFGPSGVRTLLDTYNN